MRVYVVTGVDLGWDCVVGVYFIHTEEQFKALEKQYGCDNPDEVSNYVIHEQFVQELVPDSEDK